MAKLPSTLLDSLDEIEGFAREAFQAVHQSGEQVTSIRFNPKKWPVAGDASLVSLRTPEVPAISPVRPGHPGGQFPNFPISQSIPWSSHGYYLNERPSFTLDPLFHAGCYYVQEASSMFLEQALKQTVDLSQPVKVLDLCAAPGGKSTLIQSFITSDSLLVSNEVIKSRVNVLQENLIKWGGANVVLTNNDAKDFASLYDYFDLLVVDAPCSGSGLFRKDPEAIGEWSENNVKLCSQRQQRILADAFSSLKKNGIIIYCTCSYSTEENEEILDWMAEKFKVESLRLTIKKEWNIVETQSMHHNLFGYRFYPDKLKGEGFFIACLQKKEGEEK